MLINSRKLFDQATIVILKEMIKMDEEELKKRRRAVSQFSLLSLFEKWSSKKILLTEQMDDIQNFCQEYGGEKKLTEDLRVLREEGFLDLIPGTLLNEDDWHFHMITEKGRKKMNEFFFSLFEDI